MREFNAHSILKRGLLLFWAIWFSLVVSTNVTDGLKTLGALDESWPYASGNYGFVVKTMARYDPPEWLTRTLFAMVIAWETMTAILFWRAWRRTARPAIYHAVIASLALWMGFMFADEICSAYAVESNHIRLFAATLVTLLAIELLPGVQPESLGL